MSIFLQRFGVQFLYFYIDLEYHFYISIAIWSAISTAIWSVISSYNSKLIVSVISIFPQQIRVSCLQQFGVSFLYFYIDLECHFNISIAIWSVISIAMSHGY